MARQRFRRMRERSRTRRGTPEGDAVSTASDDAARAFDVPSGTAWRLSLASEADPGCGMAHVVEGCLLTAPLDSALLPRARAGLWRTRRVTHRGRAHAAALVAWGKGGVDRALALRKKVPEGHPRDVPAFRLRRRNAFRNA